MEKGLGWHYCERIFVLFLFDCMFFYCFSELLESLPATESRPGIAFGVAQFFKVDTVRVGKTFSICAGWVTWCCKGLGVDRGPETQKQEQNLSGTNLKWNSSLKINSLLTIAIRIID